MNLAGVLRAGARNRPDHPAIEWAGGTLSYEALWREVTLAAGWLAELGVEEGDRVGLCLKEHPAHLVLHFAIPYLGAVLVPMDHRWTDGEKLATGRSMSVKLLIHEPSATPVQNLASAALPEAWPARDEPPALADGGEQIWLVSLSSGTTGRPKGALVSHQQMLERFINQWVTLGFNVSDRFYAASPLYFGAGRSFAMCFLAAGATVVMSPPPQKPDQILREINELAVTAAFLVPTSLRRIAPLADGSQPAWPNLRRLVVSGEPLFPDEAALFRERLCPRLLAYYASSEGGGVSVLQPQDFGEYSATVGRAGFRLEVEIVDPDGEPLPAGETGRLRYRGPGLARAFVDECGQQQDETDGWFYPGDLASVDSRGFITLRGREKDVIIRGGVNIYPAEIERLLGRQPGVAEVAVVGRESEGRGQEVVAFYAGDADPLTLQAVCKEQLAPYKVPAKFVCLAELPKAGSGKINKKALPDP
ncbi:MAG: class I adenylate-forming enzyme family protein [Pseudomonadota bacterium]